MSKLAGIFYLLEVESPQDGNGNYAVIAGLQSHDDNFEAGNIEITNFGSSQWKEFLTGAGPRSIKVGGTGVVDDGAHFALIRTAWKDRSNLKARIREVQSDGTTTVRSVTGNWKVPSFSETGKHDEAHTFSITLESNGEMTFA